MHKFSVDMNTGLVSVELWRERVTIMDFELRAC